MKLLLLTPQLPFPPHQGTTIRNYNILKQLATRHEIHLISFGGRSELEGSPLHELAARIEIADPPHRTMARRAFETFFSPLPDMARRLDSRALADLLARALSQTEFDIIQVEGIEMARYVLYDRWWRLDREQRPPVVFDDHNAEWVLQKTGWETDRTNPARWHGALYSWIQWHKLARFERSVCRNAQHVVVVSEADAEAIRALDSQLAPTVIPNGVDVEYYVPSNEVCAKPLAELGCVFTGKMDFRPNVDAALWFADEVLPRLRQMIPRAHVAFVGQRPHERITALSRREGIHVTGWVPDTRPYIADAAVYVVPLRMGGGTRLKVLEAMAMGKAIVSTPLGVSGIACQDGREVVIADRADEFARAVASLIRDRERARELGQNARRLVEAQYDWRNIVTRFDGVYARVVR